jgi:hypothetical protein
MANTFQSSGNPHISERRMCWRQKVFFSRVELGENNRGDLLNLSPSGLALKAVEELTDDELPNIRFQLSQAPAWIEAKGRIAWRDDSKKVAVRNYLIRIFDKLGISSRVELVLYAFSGSEGTGSPENAKTFSASA